MKFKPTGASANGWRSREKGIAFERAIAARLRAVFPEARRHFEFRRVEASNGHDLIHTAHYRFQLKKTKRYASIATIGEIVVDELAGEIPVLVTAGDREEPMAVIPFEHLVRLLLAERDASERD
jgi:hypothetical protein